MRLTNLFKVKSTHIFKAKFDFEVYFEKRIKSSIQKLY